MQDKAEVLRTLAAGRVQDVIALLNEELTVAQVASRHDVTEDTVASWKRMYLEGLKSGARSQRAGLARWSRRLSVGLGVGTASVALLVAGVSAAQVTCSQTLPAPLRTFCPNAPAVAADVNGNFRAVYDWISQKVGTPGDANITVGSGATMSFGSSTRQMINTWGSSYGIGVQNNAQYYRSGGGHMWYRGGVHAQNARDPGSGGATLATLDSDGNFEASGRLGTTGQGLSQRSCNWRNVGKDHNADDQFHEVTCSPGEYAAGWRCWASDYMDGYCAVYCCLP